MAAKDAKRPPDGPAKQVRAVICRCSRCGRSRSIELGAGFPGLEAVSRPGQLGRYVRRLRCSACGSKAVEVINDRGQVLFNTEALTPCPSCEDPIPEPRLATLTEDAVCASCAERLAEPPSAPPYPKPPANLRVCPRCGNATVVRENSSDGTYFIGCMAFPRCRWTADL